MLTFNAWTLGWSLNFGIDYNISVYNRFWKQCVFGCLFSDALKDDHSIIYNATHPSRPFTDVPKPL